MEITRQKQPARTRRGKALPWGNFELALNHAPAGMKRQGGDTFRDRRAGWEHRFFSSLKNATAENHTLRGRPSQH
jgi:hypothetical protein